MQHYGERRPSLTVEPLKIQGLSYLCQHLRKLELYLYESLTAIELRAQI
jgi:hypothetical protein